MAIKKAKVLESGVTVEYHRIVRAPSVANSSDNSNVEVICEEFISKAYKKAGKLAVSAKSYSVEISKSEIENSSAFAVAYTKLMLLPEFAGAIEE
jgi:hypothetical protein